MEGRPQQKAHEFWGNRYEASLGDEDAKEINENLATFFQILLEWERLEEGGELQKGSHPLDPGGEGGEEGGERSMS